jgi:multifunctional 2-oxoglutarate metabolism enzyme
METSLGVPTATSVRDVPAKLLEVNRRIVNNYLRRTRGGKVSFTHLIAYAMVKAVEDVPAMTNTFAEVDGKPAVMQAEHFGLGLAVDVEKDDGSRSLLVPVIQDADTLDFEAFLRAYEDLIRKIRTNKLDPEMFAGGTITITNPGTIGTVHSIPRLMAGQSAILGVGSIDYPPSTRPPTRETIAKLGVSKVITLTSTYDHRVIQGAESGMYLKRVHELLLGEDGFYDEVFRSLGLPYEPARWRTDTSALDSETDLLAKQMKVDQLANMYRVRGHLIADLDPLRQKDPSDAPRARPDLLRVVHLGPRPRVPGRRRRRHQQDAARRDPRDPARRLLPHDRHRVRPRARPRAEAVDPRPGRGVTDDVIGRGPAVDPRAAERRRGVRVVPAHQVRRAEAVRARGCRVADPAARRRLRAAADDGDVDDIVMGMAHRGRLNVLSNIVGKSHNQIFASSRGTSTRTPSRAPATSSTTSARGHLRGPVGGDVPSCTCRRTRPTSRRSTRSSRAWPARCRTATTAATRASSRSCRC